MIEYKDRLKHSMEQAGYTISSLASALKLSYQAVSKVYKGDSNSFTAENNTKAATILKVNPNWLATGKGEMLLEQQGTPVMAWHQEEPLPDTHVSIPVSSVVFKGGSGREFEYQVDDEQPPVAYQMEFFQKKQVNPEQCKRFTVTGDSMERFLFDGDSVLVHMDNDTPRDVVNGKIYAIRYDNELKVKYLHRRLDGGLILRSENPAHAEEQLTSEQVNEYITIIGRVIDRSGSGGL